MLARLTEGGLVVVPMGEGLVVGCPTETCCNMRQHVRAAGQEQRQSGSRAGARAHLTVHAITPILNGDFS